jgi:hypothetical protein
VDVRAWLAYGAVHVSALHHGGARDEKPQHHPPECDRATPLHGHTRAVGASRVRCIKAGTIPVGLVGTINPQLVVPQLFPDNFPGWFAGIAQAAIGAGSLVPAVIMSITASNLFTRNIYRDLFGPNSRPQEETKVPKVISLLVKVGALIFVLLMDQFAAITAFVMNALVSALFTAIFRAKKIRDGEGMTTQRATAQTSVTQRW